MTEIIITLRVQVGDRLKDIVWKYDVEGLDRLRDPGPLLWDKVKRMQRELLRPEVSVCPSCDGTDGRHDRECWTLRSEAQKRVDVEREQRLKLQNSTVNTQRMANSQSPIAKTEL